jgi:hypothetical protein
MKKKLMISYYVQILYNDNLLIGKTVFNSVDLIFVRELPEEYSKF